jgi:hypothetical protein
MEGYHHQSFASAALFLDLMMMSESAFRTTWLHDRLDRWLAGARGKPDFAKTVELKIEPRASASGDANAKSKPTTPTKLWAALVLSGVGR